MTPRRRPPSEAWGCFLVVLGLAILGLAALELSQLVFGYRLPIWVKIVIGTVSFGFALWPLFNPKPARARQDREEEAG